MTVFAEVQGFIRAVKEAPDIPAVGGLLDSIARDFGFDCFGLVKAEHGARAHPTTRLSTFPDAWLETLETDGRFMDDPVLAASARAAAPFSWTDLPAILPLTARQSRYMDDARGAGLANGFTVPLHVPGIASGLCSFAVRAGRDLPDRMLPAAQYLACFAFETVRRLEAAGGGKPRAVPPRLTPRQLDCTVLIARGKSDWVAGRLLELSPETVKSHINAAKRRFGVASRTELVVGALFTGQLTFGDLGY